MLKTFQRYIEPNTRLADNPLWTWTRLYRVRWQVKRTRVFASNRNELGFADDYSEQKLTDHYSELEFADDYIKQKFTDHYSKLGFAGYYSEPWFADRYNELGFADHYSELKFAG